MGMQRILRISMSTGVMLLLFADTVTASFFADLIKSAVVSVSEQQEVENAPDCASSADDALAHVVELLSDGRQAETTDLLRSAVKSHRDDVRILFAKAVLERSCWNKEAAQVWFAMVRKAKGNEVLSRAAWLSMQLDQKESVDENLAELIRLSDENPDNVFLLWLGAILCREQSRHSSPLPRLERQRMAEIGAERYKMLLDHFEFGPIMAHHTYANILTENLNRSDEALEHRLIAVSMAARSWTLEGLADTLTTLKKYRWACVTWRQATKMNDGNARYYNRWGDALFGLKQYGEAAEKYNEAVLRDPEYGYYWRDLGTTLARLGKEREREAFDAYQQAVKLGVEEATTGMAWCYRTGHGVERDDKKAFDLYQHYRNANPKSAWVLRELAIYYNHGDGTEKNPKKALEYYEKAVALSPDNWCGLNGLAWTLNIIEEPELQDYPRAIELAQRAVEMDGNHETLGTLAMAYFKNGQYDEAVKTQERVVDFWRVRKAGNPVPEGVLIKLEEYRRAYEETMEVP